MNLKRKCGAWMIFAVLAGFAGGASWPASLEFGISRISNRVLTPNGDGKNDRVVFEFYNAADLEFSGRIFDLNWALVAHMSPGTEDDSDSLQWDGKRQGSVVPSGVYIYRIRAENKIFTGIILVIR